MRLLAFFGGETVADGRITIDTKIDTSGIVTGFGDIMKACTRMAGKAEGLRDSVKASFAQQADSIQKTVKAHKEQEKSAVKAIRQQEELGEQKVPTEEYRKLGEAIEETKKKIKEVEDQQKEWMNLGFPLDSEAFDATDAALVKLNRDMEALLQRQAEMREKGTDFVGGGTVAPEASGNENPSETGNVVAEAAKEVGGYVTALQASLNGLKTVVSTSIPLLVEGALSGLKMMLSGVVSGLKNVGKLAQKTALALAQLAGRGIIGGLKKLAAGIFGIGKSANKSTVNFNGMAKSMLKYGLGIRSLYALVNKLRSAMQEGMKNLAQYSTNTNAALSGLMSSLAQCKNALATAFDPILQAVAPALNYLINLVTAAATAVAQLIAALTGKGTFIKAVKVQKDYAKSIAGTGSAAKKAGEEAEGSLASFDRLNVMAEENSGGSDGGGGRGRRRFSVRYV